MWLLWESWLQINFQCKQWTEVWTGKITKIGSCKLREKPQIHRNKLPHNKMMTSILSLNFGHSLVSNTLTRGDGWNLGLCILTRFTAASTNCNINSTLYKAEPLVNKQAQKVPKMNAKNLLKTILILNLSWSFEGKQCSILSSAILDKSPWDSTAIYMHIFLSFLGSVLKEWSFSKFSCTSPSPHPIKSWNSEKILDTHVQHCLWVRGGVGPVWIGKRPRNAKVSQGFSPWL